MMVEPRTVTPVVMASTMSRQRFRGIEHRPSKPRVALKRETRFELATQGVERFELPTSAEEERFELSEDMPRDFKSLVSKDGFESRPVVAGMKTRCLSPQGFETPRGHYPQQAVNTCIYPRINTHKPLRINTHKSCVIHALTLTNLRINTHKVWPAAQTTQGFWPPSFIFYLYLFYLILEESSICYASKVNN